MKPDFYTSSDLQVTTRAFLWNGVHLPQFSYDFLICLQLWNSKFQVNFPSSAMLGSVSLFHVQIVSVSSFQISVFKYNVTQMLFNSFWVWYELNKLWPLNLLQSSCRPDKWRTGKWGAMPVFGAFNQLDVISPCLLHTVKWSHVPGSINC